jgi:hypothetical protein
MAVITAKVSLDNENLKDVISTLLSSNNNPWASIASVCGETKDTENALEVQLDTQRTEMEEIMKSTEGAMGSLQNTQRMQME